MISSYVEVLQSIYSILHLELHEVWLVVCRKSELGGKVCRQHRDSLDGLDKGIVDLLLVSLALVTDDGWLWCVSQEKFFLTLSR